MLEARLNIDGKHYGLDIKILKDKTISKADFKDTLNIVASSIMISLRENGYTIK